MRGRPAQVHDFTARRWGWHIERWNGEQWTGHGYGIANGDTVLLPMQSGKVGKHIVSELRYERDPRDMFWCRLTFDGYA